MQFKDVVDIVESIAVIIAAVVAIFGINAWRREHVGRRRIDLAEEVLAMFYEVRMVMGSIRSRYVFAGEGSSREVEEDETPDLQRKRDRDNVINERFAQHRAMFARLSSARFRFMAVFGADKGALFEKFDKLVMDLTLAAQTLADLLSISEFGVEPHDFGGSGDYEKQLIAARRAFYGSRDENDPFKKKLDMLIIEVEAICRKEMVEL